MTGKKAREYLRSHVLGLVAIFIALTGTAVAGSGRGHESDGPTASTAVVTDAKFKRLKRRVAALEAKPAPTVPTIPTSLPPRGPAGGVLDGTYPNPGLADEAVTGQKIASGAITANKFAIARSMQLLNFPSTNAGNCSVLTVPEPGGISRFSDHILATPPGFWADTFTLTARADGDNDNVRLVACNVFGGGGAADPDGANGGFYSYLVIRQQ